MFTFMKAFWPVEEPITKAIQRTEAQLSSKVSQVTARTAQTTASDPQFLKATAGKARTAVLAKLIEERNVYQALIRKGKGTWNTPDYISDEIWASWLHTLSVLNRILEAQ